MEPTAVTPHDRSEIAPTFAMLVGSMIMPEPIMLTATSMVSCMRLIFFVLAIVSPLSLVSRTYDQRNASTRFVSSYAQYVVGTVVHLRAFGHVSEARELLLPALQSLHVADVRRVGTAEVL